MSSDPRRELWIAMSNLWLDTELDDAEVRHIAAAVQRSGLSRSELEDVFRYELAPFLGPNLLSVAGVWNGFDSDWVCAEAAKRRGRKRLGSRVAAALGLTTYAARPAWNRVLTMAFSQETG